MPLDERETLAITVICGYQGAGKSQLIKNLRGDPQSRIGVIVCDGEGDSDLLAQIENDVLSGDFDSLIIESGPRTHPLEFALLIENGDERVDAPQGVFVDTIISVMDVSQLLTQLQAARSSSRFSEDNEVDEADPRSLPEVLMDQIESSDILILNKTDLVPATQLSQIEALMIRLNPRAKLFFAENGNTSASEILGGGLYDFEAVEMGAGWLAQLSGEFEGLGESKE